MRFLSQLAELRFGRMSRFAIIGAFGAIANLAIMAGLTAAGMYYAAAATAAAAATIVGNFFFQERFVFRELRTESRLFWTRFGSSFAFNGTEALIRLPILVILVEHLFIPNLIAQGATIACAFFARFVFHAQVVYRPRGSGAFSAKVSSLAATRVWPTHQPTARTKLCAPTGTPTTSPDASFGGPTGTGQDRPHGTGRD
jgi:dolichol-phosphate mannosyltransferase